MTGHTNFPSVETHPWKAKYIARCTPWNWHSSDMIDVVDNQGRVAATLDTWQTIVFHQSDGNQTVQELIAWVAGHYNDPHTMPSNLDDIILTALRELLDDLKVVTLWDHADDLPDAYDLPRDEQVVKRVET